MIISTDIESPQNPVPIHGESTQKTKNQRELLRHDKGHLRKTTANIQ